MTALFLGIDVGTSGARAGVFDETGAFLGAGNADFPLYQFSGGRAEYASAEIWDAVCRAVRDAVAKSGAAAGDVAGIGFDATCSMVVTPGEAGPISINADPPCDAIAWLDHRAIAEAEEINDTGSAVLQAVGGRISPEMQVPKLTWLARHRPDVIETAGAFYDLPDWLVHRATGNTVRSLCSLVCKWTYNGNGPGWDRAFFDGLGLGALLDDDAQRIGNEVRSPGGLAGGLTAGAAAELGLAGGTPVAVSLIDAHAGALGTLGLGGKGALALIAGTSACHIVLTEEARPVPGVWGPYPDVILDGCWALEAGQSACGALLDAVIDRHAASVAMVPEGDIHKRIAGLIAGMAGDAPPSHLTVRRHVLPDVLGNRAPLADPTRQGAIWGLGLSHGPKDLALDYLAAVQALACGTRHILDQMAEFGVEPREIVVSGGLIKNALFLQETATMTGCEVLVPEAQEPVLLGSAMLGAVASGRYSDVATAMTAMQGNVKRRVTPDPKTRAHLDAKYRVFRRMLNDHAAYDALMAGAMTGEDGDD